MQITWHSYIVDIATCFSKVFAPGYPNNFSIEAVIGFSNTSYSTPEGEGQVCVSLQNGTLQDNVIIRYSISVTNITATRKTVPYR